MILGLLQRLRSLYLVLLDLEVAKLFLDLIITTTSIIALWLGLFVIQSNTILQWVVFLIVCLAWIWTVWRSLTFALYDRLTGLPNRSLLIKQLDRAIRRAKRLHNKEFAVFLLDLDRFRSVNETLGYQKGDRLLVAVVSRLQQDLSPTCTLARVGGNEFALLCQSIAGTEQAIRVAHQLQLALSSPFHLGEQDVFATASIGITLSHGYFWSDDLLKDAQLAMYHAKRQGRARYVLFQPSMRVQAVPLSELEADLRRAIDRQELRLHYQPLISLRTGRIAGFEALVRWQHSKHGLISPTEFIPIAESTGLIGAIGGWILDQACRQLYLWQQRFPEQSLMLISVNLSSRQFAQPHFVEQVSEVLRETGLAAQCLKLEITESMVMEDVEAAIAILHQFKALNIRLGIDDFGTGYSSLSHLYRLPVDTLKIDQSFVSRIGDRGENDEIIWAVISLAHRLNMTVIAEGVETADQLEWLRSLHCEYGQGFFFSEPLDQEATELLLARSPSW